ncbi:hypothetical protein [Sphingopyxis panaciterrulae]|uniref:Uncharacterized protein n=1 Tax=Sphingopyxis panaciterrulae TaxID=462372 RepID=A0A7W9ESP1_9SPHN|nr:hypothetical protein [Sphingopyxis panaciterrulae]MBB5707355.1 hypothetical protein [Sphingopyxis panaciterrulae]
MRVAIFALLLLAALGYAAWRGGGPERVMAGIASTMVGADFLLHRFVAPEYAVLDFGHLLIDGFGASATLLLALFAHRFWPMMAAVLHILPLLAHFSRVFNLQMDPAAYMIMQVAASWLVPPLLLLATWRHHRRLRTTGNDPSWHISSQRFPRTTAKN